MGLDVNAMPRQFYPRERTGNHCIGGWIGPRAGLDWCGKSLLPPGFDPRSESLHQLRYPEPQQGLEKLHIFHKMETRQVITRSAMCALNFSYSLYLQSSVN